MASNCGHETIEMNGEWGHCTRCGRVVGEAFPDGWEWLPGEDPSVYRANLLAIRVLCGESRRKAT